MVKLPAILTGFSSKTDGSSSIRFSTQELSDSEFLEIKKHHSLYGWLLFQEGDDIKVPKEQLPDMGKSPGQRLRKTFFCLYEQRNIQTTFDSYYAMQMEKVINTVKSKLD